MPLVLEDGTGVIGANSYITAQEAVDYCADRQLVLPSDDDLLLAAVLEGGEYLQNEMRYTFRGTRNSYQQGMPFPRTGCTPYRSTPVPSNVVPWPLKDAQKYLTYLASLDPGNLQAVLERGGYIKSKKVDVLSTEFMDNAPVEAVIQKVQGLLATFLVPTGTRRANTPVYFPPTNLDPFTTGEFNNPSPGGEPIDITPVL